MNLILTLRSEIVCMVTLLMLLWYSSVHGFYDSAKRYTMLNVLAIGHVLFDIITVITVNNLDTVPPLVNRICHEIFYMFAILFCYILVCIVLDLTYGQSKRTVMIKRILAVIPAVYLIAMSFLPIEYVQGNGTNYSFGPCVFAGYACAMVLFLISVILVIVNMKKMSVHDRTALIPAHVIMMIAMLLQIRTPELLFTGADITLVTAAVFIGVVDPVGKFKHKAYFDQMTGLRNHNCYDDDLERFRKDAAKDAERSLIYVACDINGLKQINDEYGHAAGDDYIRHAARSLREALTGAQAIYRTGGDEFCAIYIDRTAGQVRAEIARLREIFGSSMADAGIKTVTDRPFSISIGYVSALNGEDIAETAARADSMMMEEKRKYYQMSGIDRRRSPR